MRKTLDYYLSLDYPVEVRRIEDDLGGGYVASIPSLGSQAFVGDGDTPQEAYDNLQAAKKEIFSEYLASGARIPEPVPDSEYEAYSGKLMLRLPRELHARVAASAKQNSCSMNQFIVYALSDFESRHEVVQQIRDELRSQASVSSRSVGLGAQFFSVESPKRETGHGYIVPDACSMTSCRCIN